MSSSDFDTGAIGSMCECGSMSGTLDSAELRSATSESAGMTHPARETGRVRITTDTSYNARQELQIYKDRAGSVKARLSHAIRRKNKAQTGVRIDRRCATRRFFRFGTGGALTCFVRGKQPPRQVADRCRIARRTFPQGEPSPRTRADTDERTEAAITLP